MSLFEVLVKAIILTSFFWVPALIIGTSKFIQRVKNSPTYIFWKARRNLKKVVPESEWPTISTALDECENFYWRLDACKKNLERIKDFYSYKEGGQVGDLPGNVQKQLQRLDNDLTEDKVWIYNQYLHVTSVPSRSEALELLVEEIQERRRAEEMAMLDLEPSDEVLTEEIEQAAAQ